MPVAADYGNYGTGARANYKLTFVVTAVGDRWQA